MLERLRPRLTYANVIATLALFLALGGGAAFAAATLGKNTVGSKQLKRNAVTGAKVKNGSLRAADFRDGELPRGERGPEGLRGERGTPGTTNVVARYGPEGKPKKGEVGQSNALCLADETVTGGGFELLEEPEEPEYDVEASGPSAGETEVEGEIVYPPPSAGTSATRLAGDDRQRRKRRGDDLLPRLRDVRPAVGARLNSRVSPGHSARADTMPAWPSANTTWRCSARQVSPAG